MKREEFFAHITLMEEQGVGHETDWFQEEKVIKFLTENNKDKSIYMAALKYNPEVIFYANDTLKDDSELIKYGVKEWGKSILRYASDRIKDDREIVNEAIDYSSNYGGFGFVLEYVSENLRNDTEIVNKAMTCCHDPEVSQEFQYASDEIKNNKDFILNQLEYFTHFYFDRPIFIKYISNELKQDTEFVKKLIEINPNTEKYLK